VILYKGDREHPSGITGLLGALYAANLEWKGGAVREEGERRSLQKKHGLKS